MHAALCVLFASFLFFYFGGLQGDIISFILKKDWGLDIYRPWLTSLCITLPLMLVHRLTRKVFYFRDRHYVLSFIPSAVIAVLLTSFVPATDVFALVCCAIALVAFIAFHIVDRRRRDMDKARVRFRVVPRITWYLMWISGLYLFIGIAGNGYIAFHTELRMARLIRAGHYAEAAAQPLTQPLTRQQIALRAYALSHTPDGLADGLFAQPMPAASHTDLYLRNKDEIRHKFPEKTIYAYLGVVPKDGEMDSAFQSRLFTYRPYAAMTPAREYYLCGLLLDRRIDAFYHAIADNWLYLKSHKLPKAWCEAITLYNRLHKPKEVIFSDANLEQNLSDFLDVQQSVADPIQQSNVLASLYGNTYWWYYFYSRIQKRGQ